MCPDVVELTVPVDQRDEQVCPTGGYQLTRHHAAPAIQFKGTGFYATDYGKKP
jgi:predicted nucleic acid-binding Zn ribbon protein